MGRNRTKSPTVCSLPFTAQTGAKHPFIKVQAQQHMWELLAMRKAFDRLWVGVQVCHFLLLFVNSFQFQRTKTLIAVFEKVDLAGVQ